MLVSPFNKIKRYLGYIQILIDSLGIHQLILKMAQSVENVFCCINYYRLSVLNVPPRIQMDLPVRKNVFGTGRKRYIYHHFLCHFH